jgi:hypothetical protein
MSERLIIYPLEREVTTLEKESLKSSISTFLQQWKAHGTPLTSQFSIEENRFILIRIDEEKANASGCSKDKLYHFVENECENLGLGLAPGHLFFVKTPVGIEAYSRKELNEKIRLNQLSTENQIFPTWVADGAEWEEKWARPIRTVLPGISASV